MVSFWFSAVAAVAWGLVAAVQLTRGEREFGLLAGVAAACFATAFVLRLLEQRRGASERAPHRGSMTP